MSHHGSSQMEIDTTVSKPSAPVGALLVGAQGRHEACSYRCRGQARGLPTQWTNRSLGTVA